VLTHTSIFFLFTEIVIMKVVPTLSSKGWAKSPEERIDKIMLYYNALNPSQTLRYKGNVLSLQYAIYRAGDDMDALARYVETDLTDILKRNFPEGHTVSVNAVQIDGTETYDIQCTLTVTSDGKRYDVANVIASIDSDFARVNNTIIKPHVG